jgi:predicted nuclease with TOPRIM domain
MSPEQIMAINPNLTEAAALALAEKYKASGKDEAWKMVAEMTQKNAEEMRKFLESQAKTQADIVKGAISNVRGEDSRAEKRTKARVDQVAKLAQKVRNPDPRRDKTEDRSSSKEFTDSEEADTSGDEENEDS